MATRTRISFEEFLELPETEPPCEYVDGEVVQKVAPSRYHGSLVIEIGYLLTAYLKRSREGTVSTEVRHADAGERRVYLPDLEVTLWHRVPRDPEVRMRGPEPSGPDLAIEVLSPEDRPRRVAEKVAYYLRSGVSIVWTVDPRRETVTVHRPGGVPEEHRAPAVIDARPVLAAFQLDLGKLFAVLHEGEG